MPALVIERDPTAIVADGDRFTNILGSIRPNLDELTVHLQGMMDRTIAIAPKFEGSVEAYRLHADFALTPPRLTTKDACQGFIAIPKMTAVLTQYSGTACFGRLGDYRNQPLITITPLTRELIAKEWRTHRKRRLRYIGVALTQARLDFAATPRAGWGVEM